MFPDTGGSAILRSKLRRALSRLPYLPRALGLVWAASRGWTVAWLALLVVQGLLPAATVYLTRALVNSLVAVVGFRRRSGDAPARRCCWRSSWASSCWLSQLLGSVTGWVRTTQGELVTDYITALVHRQCVRLDLAFYDSADYFDRLHRARAEAGYRPLSLLESLGGLLQNGITLVAMAAILLPYGAWLPVALLVSTLPALYIVLHYRVPRAPLPAAHRPRRAPHLVLRLAPHGPRDGGRAPAVRAGRAASGRPTRRCGAACGPSACG